MRLFLIKTLGWLAGFFVMMLLWWLITFICSFIARLWHLMRGE